MLAKKTSKSQIALPKAIVRQLPDVDHFEVSLHEGSVILTPAIITASDARLRAVRAKMRSLGLTERDVDDAIAWARRRHR